MLYVYYRREETLLVKLMGHANSGPFGDELVCAAASILTHTVFRYLNGLKKEENAKIVDFNILSGAVELLYTPREEEWEEVAKVVDIICNGFAILAANFPENIEYLKTGKN